MIVRVTKKAVVADKEKGYNLPFPDSFVLTVYLFGFIPVFRYRKSPR